MTAAADSFEPHRRFLVRLAYRMLGSVAEAEDAVQDAFLRWSAASRDDVVEPRAFLARTVSRLCLDKMKSATARRESYVGTWLPEPMVDDTATTTIADDISVALLMTLERLSPLERAAFLLHDVFDMDYRDIAGVLERSEPACRQLATRARDHVRDEQPRFTATDEQTERLATAFHGALQTGDVDGIARLLHDDCVFYTDGGGKRLAALNPIYGKDKILRFVGGLASKQRVYVPEMIERVRINNLPGFVVHGPEGIETMSLEIDGDKIVAIYGIRNPDKLRHLS
jgi:RNA polymerase sigma-70 factor (ECF subfamily)